ncbi:hypothetical protein BH11CYA1_BH11CYA1_03230 [soil metagenome]
MNTLRTSPLYAAQVAGLLAVCGFLACIYTTCWGSARGNPYAIEYEGHVLWACMQLADGANIYDLNALTNEPWSVVIYNPFYFVLGGLLLKLFGNSFEPLRFLTMASTLVCFVSFGALLKRCRVSDFNMILVLACFAATLPVLHWSSVARVDMLGLSLMVIALERFVKAWLDSTGGDKPKPSIAAVAFAILALFTKQQYFIAMVATVLFALYKGKKRLAGQYLAAYSIISLVIAAAIQALSGGYFAHLTYAAGLPWEWETIKLFLIPFLLDPKTISVALIIAVASRHKTSAVSAEQEKEEEEEEEQQQSFAHKSDELAALPTILLICSSVLALYTMGLRGAFHNHLLCCELALFWLAGIKLAKAPAKYATISIFATAASLSPLLGFTGEMAFCQGLRPDTAETITLLRQRCSNKSVLLSEDPSLAIFAGSVPAMIDATTILNIGALHPGQLDCLLKRIEQKAYGAVIINAHDANEQSEHIWRLPVVSTISKYYRPIRKSGGNGMRQIVFLPNP